MMMELLSVESPRQPRPMFMAERRVLAYPGQRWAYVSQWRSAVLSRLSRQSGFITAWVLTTPETDEVTIMSQWSTEDDYRAWCRSYTRCQVHAHIGGLVREHVSERGRYITVNG